MNFLLQGETSFIVYCVYLIVTTLYHYCYYSHPKVTDNQLS